MKLWKTLSWMLILVLAIGFAGCSDDDDDDDGGTNPEPTMTDHFDGIFALDAKFGNNITADNLWTLMQGASPADDALFIIDFRGEDHYNNGHIEGAVNWSIKDLIDNLDQIPATAQVVCVCYTGQTASQASAALNLLGYDAWNLKFGMCGWTSDEDINLGKWTTSLPEYDVPMVTDPFTLDDTFEYPVLELETEDVMEAVEYYLDMYLSDGTKNIAADALYANLVDGDTSNDPTILNYWNETMYNDGHIQTAVQANPIDMTLLEGVDPEKPVVVYCHTGQTSSKIVCWLNALGYDAYSMLFGVNSIDTEFPGLTTYHAPDTDYEVIVEP